MMPGLPMISRRDWLVGVGIAGVGLTLSPWRSPVVRAAEPDLSGLASMTGSAVPISSAERGARLIRAQSLMKANGIGALIVEPGSSLDYFTGIKWWRSERLTALVLPQEGEACIVTPFFEEPSIRQMLDVPAQVRVWQEDQDPLKILAGFLTDRKIATQPIGIEETVRYFILDNLKRALPDARLVSGNPAVRGCRMIKTAPEIALMQMASDVTIAAYRWVYPRIERGMRQTDIAALVNAAQTKLGGENAGALILVGESAAYPHGSNKPQVVADGEVVLLDSGCSVHGYTSDISRTFVYGAASKAQRKVWEEVKQGQQVALAAAKLGTPAGKVDDAVRTYYESLGYGPLYRLPGLSHRTGHGIGMDGHEPINLVRGETTPLAVGMCFSNEPGLYLPGSFGIRFEDCFHMTETGPEWFSAPPTSFDKPFG